MAETDFKYDVFVSYSSANKEWVRKTFVPILEKAGLRVCDYYRDFDVGAPIVMEMERAILESRKTIPVLSPAYLKSGWTEFESLMLQTLDAANRERKLLPVILEICELPLRLKYMNCINFANPDDVEIEWQRLSRALEVTLSPSLLDPKTSDFGSRENWHLAHPYPMPPNFTGRAAELKMLDDWLSDDKDRLFILRALGGFGKSALAWQWINTHVNPAEWTKLVWWSFYEGDASFEHFIEETLKYLKLEVPQGQRPQVDELLKAMQSQKLLLIMDGFERTLRLYGSMNAAYQDEEEQEIEDDQLAGKDINAEWFLKGICSLPGIKSKVLITTRLTPRAVKPRKELLQGCREEELTAMQKEDAIEFFHRQKIKGTHAEIEAACAPYGYHPLSLRILAGLIINDRQKPGDIAAADLLEITNDIVQNKNHVLQVSYDSLSFGQQKLLSNMACFRSFISYHVLRIITNKPSWKRENKPHLNEKLDKTLEALESRGLTNWDRDRNKYDLHPLVRHYVYQKLATSDRIAAHTRLRNYFATIDTIPKPQSLDDLIPIIELYYHTVKAGELDNALKLYANRLARPLYYQMGAYQTVIELLRALFSNREDERPSLKGAFDQSWTLAVLANAYSLSGQPRRAILFYEEGIQIAENVNKQTVAAELIAVASAAQIPVGLLKAAEQNLHTSLNILDDIKHKRTKLVCHLEYGRVLTYIGLWGEAEEKFLLALKEFENFGASQTNLGSSIWAYRALCRLLFIRQTSSQDKNVLELALTYSQNALEFANETSGLLSRVPLDYIRSYWLLGAVYRAKAVLTSSVTELVNAEEYLLQAINMSRQINNVESEANILLDLARLRYDQKKHEEAKSLAEEALLITERCGYVLQGADVNLFLAQYASEQEKDKARAKEYAETALKLAYCDGPPYYYKVAYEEAERMLEKLK